MNCNECIHRTACFDWCRGFGQEAELCEHFSDKSEWFHLVGKDCKTAYYAVGYGDEARVIEEPICGWGINNGKECVIDEYGDFYEIGEDVFLTREEAQKDVERRRKIND